MNKPAKYIVALFAGAAAIGVVAVVAVPIVSEGAEVDMSATMQQVVPTVFDSPDATGEASTPSTTWSLDADSTVGYRMSTVDDVEIGGSSSQISGVISRSGGEITDAEFMLDLATLVGEDPARGALLDALIRATGGNSMASFVLTEPATIDSSAAEPGADSSEATVPIVGVLTLRGISNEVHGEATVDFDSRTGTITGSIPIDLDDYGIPLSALGVAQLDETAYIDVDLVATPAR